MEVWALEHIHTTSAQNRDGTQFEEHLFLNQGGVFEDPEDAIEYIQILHADELIELTDDADSETYGCRTITLLIDIGDGDPEPLEYIYLLFPVPLNPPGHVPPYSLEDHTAGFAR